MHTIKILQTYMKDHHTDRIWDGILPILRTVVGHCKLFFIIRMFLYYDYYSEVFITEIIKHVLDYLYFVPLGCPAFGHFTAH